MPFLTLSQFYRCCQYTYPYFPGVIFTITPCNTFSKPLAAFPHNHRVKTMDSGESIFIIKACSDAIFLLVSTGAIFIALELPFSMKVW